MCGAAISLYTRALRFQCLLHVHVELPANVNRTRQLMALGHLLQSRQRLSTMIPGIEYMCINVYMYMCIYILKNICSIEIFQNQQLLVDIKMLATWQQITLHCNSCFESVFQSENKQYATSVAFLSLEKASSFITFSKLEVLDQ